MRLSKKQKNQSCFKKNNGFCGWDNSFSIISTTDVICCYMDKT